jgi:hypothetical protein
MTIYAYVNKHGNPDLKDDKEYIGKVARAALQLNEFMNSANIPVGIRKSAMITLYCNMAENGSDYEKDMMIKDFETIIATIRDSKGKR